MSLPSLGGYVAIVTGAARGIGEEIARRFALQGAQVVVADKDQQEGESVVNDIQSQGGTAIFEHCDIGKKGDLDSLVSQTLNRFGRIDILVNNAFFWNFKKFEEQEWDDLRAFADVNFVGITYLTQQCMKWMRLNEVEGSVICITSVHEKVLRRDHPPYSMCKAAIAILVKELAAEYGPYGIRANAIAPGHIETDKKKVHAHKRARNKYVLLKGQSGLPDDIAKMAVFLASPETAPHITGTTITIDGGERLYGEWTDRLGAGHLESKKKRKKKKKTQRRRKR